MTNTDNDPSKKQNKTFLLNLGAWPRSYANPIEETKKKLIRNKWKEIPSCTVKEQTYCFEKQSKEPYLHFLGFAIVTGPYDMDIDDVIQNCGKNGSATPRFIGSNLRGVNSKTLIGKKPSL